MKDVPDHTPGLSFVALRRGGLLAVHDDGRVFRVEGSPGVWTLYEMRLLGQHAVWTAWTRRACVRALLAYVAPATVAR